MKSKPNPSRHYNRICESRRWNYLSWSLRSLECQVWLQILKEKRKKLDHKSYQDIHVGYKGID